MKMNNFAIIITCMLTCALFITGCGRSPSTREIEKAVGERLPPYVKITNLTVQDTEKTNENWNGAVKYTSRFKADVQLTETLYTRDGGIEDYRTEGPVFFLKPLKEAGNKFGLIGDAVTTYRDKEASISIVWQDAANLHNLSSGGPISDFANEKTILRGSREEKEFQAGLEKMYTEAQANLTSGVWGYTVGKSSGNMVFDSDHTIIDYDNDGTANYGTWTLSGRKLSFTLSDTSQLLSWDVLILSNTKLVLRRNNGEGVVIRANLVKSKDEFLKDSKSVEDAAKANLPGVWTYSDNGNASTAIFQADGNCKLIFGSPKEYQYSTWTVNGNILTISTDGKSKPITKFKIVTSTKREFYMVGLGTGWKWHGDFTDSIDKYLQKLGSLKTDLIGKWQHKDIPSVLGGNTDIITFGADGSLTLNYFYVNQGDGVWNKRKTITGAWKIDGDTVFEIIKDVDITDRDAKTPKTDIAGKVFTYKVDYIDKKGGNSYFNFSPVGEKGHLSNATQVK